MGTKKIYIYIIAIFIILFVGTNIFIYKSTKNSMSSKTLSNQINDIHDVITDINNLAGQKDLTNIYDELDDRITKLNLELNMINKNIHIIINQDSYNITSAYNESDKEYVIGKYINLLNKNNSFISQYGILRFKNNCITLENNEEKLIFGNKKADEIYKIYQETIEKYRKLYYICRNEITKKELDEAGFLSNMVVGYGIDLFPEARDFKQEMELFALEYELIREEVLLAVEQYKNNTDSKNSLDAKIDEFREIQQEIADYIIENREYLVTDL